MSDTKGYDGTLTSNGLPAVGTLYSTDTVTGLVQAYQSKNVLGSGDSTLQVTGYLVNDGDGGADYTVTLQTATGTITPAALTISAVSDIKGYDGTPASSKTPTYQVTGLAADTLYVGDSFTSLGEAFRSKNALGDGGSTLAASYVLSDGNGGANYTVGLETATGTITPATLTAAIIGDPTKIYDGTTNATLTPANFSLSGLASGEGFTVTQTAGTYNSKDVTTATTVTASLAAGDFTPGLGTRASDYTLPTTASGAGNITPAALTISAVSDTKGYDGTPASSKTPTYQVTGLAADTLYVGDSFTSLGEAFQSKNVLGSGDSTLQVTGYLVNDGDGGADYTVTLQTATGTITPAALTISAVSDTKGYDGTPASSKTPTYQVTGLAADTLYVGDSFTSLGEAFQSKNALGDGGSTLAASYVLSDGNPTPGANYAVTSQTATGTITPAAPTVSVTDAGGPYNTDPYPATDASATGVGTDGTIASFGNPSLSYSYYSGATLLPGAPTAAGCTRWWRITPATIPTTRTRTAMR